MQGQEKPVGGSAADGAGREAAAAAGAANSAVSGGSADPLDSAGRETLRRAVGGLSALGPWPAGSPVALACSGGADSTFLALAWREFAAAEQGPPGRIFVVDHGHRAGTAAEAARAAEIYRALGAEVRVLRGGPSEPVTEERLRELRYALLARAARECGARVLLTAHQADDVAETVLLRILRGTGLRGLAGIPERRTLEVEGWAVELRRPLLALRAGEIRGALAGLGVAWIEDPTNESFDCAARNRVRHELLPRLAEVATGDPVRALLRLASEAREWRAALEEILAEDGEWRALPAHLRRQAVAARLREHGRTVSPARLRDLEGALLARGSAGVDARLRLTVRGGPLRAAPRPPA